jgi:hypothetical protein
VKLRSFNFNNLKNSSETRSFVAVFGIAVVVVSLTAFFAFRPEAGTSGTQIAQDTFSIVTPPPSSKKDSLQLRTFKLKRNPKPTPPAANACLHYKLNDEADIFVGSDPPPGGAAVPGGLVRVWVDDGNGGSVAEGEKIDASTGRITTAGDRRGSDGAGAGYYLWEPAIYLTKLTSPDQPPPYSGDVENGGTPMFPQIVKGKVNYADGDSEDFMPLPPVDPPGGFDTRKRRGHGGNMAQFIWEVNSLGLSTGYYRAQIIVHDGDGDLAMNCITIQI